MLPDGAIFCGECGRAVTAAASRRPAAATPVEQAPPPPLQQPDPHGRRPDPATEAWLPESTLDPATRAWLTGEDRRDTQPPAPVPVYRPADAVPRSAPTHVHGGDSGLSSGPREHAVPAEPSLDPNGYPDAPVDPSTLSGTEHAGAAAFDDVDDPEVTRVARRAQPPRPDGDRTPTGAPSQGPAAASWAPPAAEPAPSAPAWWVGRANTDADPDGARSAEQQDLVDQQHPGDQRADGADAAAGPQPGDTAVVEPLVDRRPPRPTPLVQPGAQGSVCHVCGHQLEPDDIFCSECGAVRPAVTAAFTGPVMPLPMTRPDWAADDSDVLGGRGDEDASEPDGGAGSTGVTESPAGPEDWSDDHDDRDSHDGEVRRGDDRSAADSAGDSGVHPGPVDGADGVDDVTSADGRPEGAHTAADVPASDGPSAERPRGAHAAPTPESDGGRAPDASSTPVSPTVPRSAPAAPGVPMAAPLPPVPGAAGSALPLRDVEDSSAGREAHPGGVLSAADGLAGDAPDDAVDDEDVDETRIVSKTPTRAPFVLHFSTGERLGVHGTGLLGRLPRPQPGERFDDLLTIHDPGKSVSKTHLELGRDGDDLWVSDRFSGNGTVIRHIDGSIRRCEPGRRYRVERGARVDVGEQFFLVQ
ncbi:hypothetical protein J7E22_12255 [Curtobacterium sp. ISL-83]|nr:zinc-ribbon domain-containing protein [Curtobacterium sp. ISL-83]MBT2503307.1 hypothetical protein [Curtobacterium sp. ISL-83]